MSFFTKERSVKAVRRSRPCDGCPVRIEIGEPAVSWVGDTGDGFSTATWHPECRSAEIDLNRQHETFRADEWMSLDDMERDDHRWLIETHPVVAARRGIAP